MAQGSYRTATLDPLPSWSASARRLTTWTWQQADAKRYADFMTFFTPTSYDATGPMDWTTKHRH